MKTHAVSAGDEVIGVTTLVLVSYIHTVSVCETLNTQAQIPVPDTDAPASPLSTVFLECLVTTGFQVVLVTPATWFSLFLCLCLPPVLLLPILGITPQGLCTGQSPQHFFILSQGLKSYQGRA